MPPSYSASYSSSRALVIGIDKYRHQPQLGFACEDADSICDALTKELGFPKKNIVLLKDAKASRAEILRAYLALSSSSEANDRLVVFFAGHGVSVEGYHGPIGYLVPQDGKVSDLSSLIRWEEFVRGSELIPAKHIFFIMDACYSGLMLQRSAAGGQKRFTSSMLSRRGRQAITAGKHDEAVSDGGGPEGKNSIFTGFLLKGIAGEAADEGGVLTASSLMQYVYEKVSGAPNSRQTPHCGFLEGSGDMILRVGKTPKIEVVQSRDDLVGEAFSVTEPIRAQSPETLELVYLAKNGYGDPDSDKFGQNEHTLNLGHISYVDGKQQVARDDHFLAVVAEPVGRMDQSLDPEILMAKLSKHVWSDVSGRPDKLIPRSTKTTLRSAIRYSSETYDSPDLWRQFLRIESSGAIEWASADQICRVVNHPDFPRKPICWNLVQTVGVVWSAIELIHGAYSIIGYSKGVQLSVNLVKTHNTYTVGFAGNKPNGKRWVDPFSMDGRMSNMLDKLKCQDRNIQLKFECLVHDLRKTGIQRIVEEVASQLGRAFNHQSQPRCFYPETREFPWDQFSPMES